MIPLQAKCEEDLIEAAEDCFGMINQYARVGRETIQRMKQCKVIARYGVGVDIVDVDAATERGILVTKSGVLSRHRHPNPVHGFVLKGRWHYLEHDWIAEEGSYVFEPPGETHTLVVPDDVDEMITYFQVNGVMYYVDPYGKHMGYEDVFTKIDMCRAHFEKVGMGADYVDRFIR